MRQTGRTGKMLDEVLEAVLSGEKRLVVIAHSHQYAKDLMYRFIEEKLGNIKFTINPVSPNCLTFDNDIVLYFRESSFKNSPSFRMQKWKVFEDHYVVKSNVERFLKEEQEKYSLK